MQTSTIKADGSAEFAGNVDFGGWNASYNSIEGARINSTGAVQVNRTSAGAWVFVGRLNGSYTSQITADGNAEFAKDVEVTDSASGVILKSPNGTRYRITVDNSGNLTTTTV